MTPRQHAHLAKRLIAACGGLDESAAACHRSRSRLGDYQNPNAPDSVMPADVITALEAYCGTPHYSRAMAEARPGFVDFQDLLTEASEDTEEAAGFQRLVRKVLADDDLDDGEKTELSLALDRREQQFGQLRAAVHKVTA